jgi:hypothetical protein
MRSRTAWWKDSRYSRLGTGCREYLECAGEYMVCVLFLKAADPKGSGGVCMPGVVCV